MHIVLGILSVLALAALVVIRMGQVARAGRELGEAASDLKGLVRKKRWQRKLGADLIREIDDPRLAATVMSCAVAQDQGAITERQKSIIVDAMATHFRIRGAEAEELFAHSRWLANEMKDLDTFLGRAAASIVAGCTETEKRDLLDLLSAVAGAEGGATDIQSHAIERLRQRFDKAH